MRWKYFCHQEAGIHPALAGFRALMTVTLRYLITVLLDLQHNTKSDGSGRPQAANSKQVSQQTLYFISQTLLSNTTRFTIITMTVPAEVSAETTPLSDELKEVLPE